MIPKENLVYLDENTLMYNSTIYNYRAVYHGLELWNTDKDGFMNVIVLEALVQNDSILGFRERCSFSGKSFASF